jgi:DNA mismatch repair protein MutL
MKMMIDLGFDIEEFGKNSIRIKAVPGETTKVKIKQLISDILDEFSSNSKPVSAGEAKEKLLKLTACHSAVKAGDELGQNGIKSLISELFSLKDATTCPHGRPAAARITNAAIASLFKR